MKNNNLAYKKTVGMLQEKERLRKEIEKNKQDINDLKEKVTLLSKKPPERIYVKKFGYEKNIWRMIFTEAIKVAVMTVTTLQINKIIGKAKNKK